MTGVRRQRWSSQEWRALLTRFASSGQTVKAFCQDESVSAASFYRWRSLLVPAAGADHIPVTSGAWGQAEHVPVTSGAWG